MKEQRWILCPTSTGSRRLAVELGVHPIVGQLLVNRGITDVQRAQSFLYPQWEQVPSPWGLRSMDTAAERIRMALERRESICIYGDYDVDGQTSTALLVRVLRSVAADPQLIGYYVPNRMDEGYGLHADAVRELAETTDLLITVDCGIVSVEEVILANSLGIDVIITDHHEPEAQLPPALAVINPHRLDCGYPFQGLAGVGVAFQLARAVVEPWDVDMQEYLDLVGLGTSADLVPLIEENRFLVHGGLRRLAQTNNLGLKALIEVCGLKAPYKASDFGYRLGPRLNAVGRMGDPSRGVRLLLTEDPDEAAMLAKELDEENRARQDLDRDIFAQAVAQVEEHGWQNDPVIVVAGEGWHPGVIGIVASRLVEKYYRPAVCMAIDEDGVAKGSARSIEGFHLFSALQKTRTHLLQFGGHAMAAGMSLRAEAIDGFRSALAGEAETQLTPEDYIPTVWVDAQLTLREINEELVEQLHALEPCGMKNPAPVLQLEAAVVESRPVGRDQTHAKMVLQDEADTTIDAIGFSLAKQLEEYSYSFDWMRFLVDPQVNEWRGNRTLQLQVSRLQPTNAGLAVVLRHMKEYPWKVSSLHRQIAEPHPQKFHPSGSVEAIDGRGQWERMTFLLNHWQAKDFVWIKTRTAEEALHVCRDIRIMYPGEPSHIGFIHSFLLPEERDQICEAVENGALHWLIAPADIEPWSTHWQATIHWFPPLGPEWWDTTAWGSDCVSVALYGREDVARTQVLVQQAFPERQQLAAFYQYLVRESGTLDWEKVQTAAAAAGIDPGVHWALGVFEELQLLRVEELGVKLLPVPAKKLDLHTAVLYNEGMEKRRQYLEYVQGCMERGFIRELKGYNPSRTRFSERRN